MSFLPQDGAGDFVASALGALSIGIWSWQGTLDKVRCCPLAAHMFGLTPGEAEKGLPLDRFAQGVHPADRARFLSMVGEACRQGGAFAAEYRTLGDDRTTRWILDHGAFKMDSSGQVTSACGIVIDMTDRLDRAGFRTASFFAPHVQNLTPLEQAAEHAVALHELMVSMPSKEAKLAQVLTNQILQILVAHIAKTLKASGVTVESDNHGFLN